MSDLASHRRVTAPVPVKASPRDLTTVSSSLGVALFLIMFLFMWVGISPYPSSSAELGTAASAGQSNLLNQLLTLGLTAGFIACGLSSPLRQTILQPRTLLVTLFIWMFVTALVSAHPSIASRKVVLSVLMALNASIFLLLPRSATQMARLLLIGSFITLGFAYFGVIFMPSRAIHQATNVIEPMLAGAWRGHFPHKNAAAAALVLLSFFGLYGWQMGYRKAGGLVVALCVFFLLHTGGKTSTAMLPFIAIISLIFTHWRWTRIPISIGGVAAFNFVAIGAAVSDPIRQLITSIGIDATFTNRADIWRIAFSAVAKKPIFGYGLDSFWKTPEMVYAGGGGATWAVAAFNAHNAYLDMMINAGVFGLILMLIWLMILPLRYIKAAEATGNDPALTLLFSRLWLYGLYASCMESTFFQNGSAVWFCLMIAVFGMRLQAKARLVS
ncbi:O-antigen ligase family protein [Ochrobactrum sp. C6C9]|uniref:O-antigen ligase family protein n=1 Tax=Ochrobactrum sp. C6C9 TaxID=2736662 RepID=UPI00352FF7EB